eukprot:TRINITY_DN68141_c3_g2_i1.p1 TRINITY_DN68141_c3_g2~~TRINITY_DN68141_c3_g2_i1.p1  ORF type:complete len:280 (+),score=23.87 TRINITY_DN68141_c3_g2_i1:27-866(+)
MRRLAAIALTTAGSLLTIAPLQAKSSYKPTEYDTVNYSVQASSATISDEEIANNNWTELNEDERVQFLLKIHKQMTERSKPQMRHRFVVPSIDPATVSPEQLDKIYRDSVRKFEQRRDIPYGTVHADTKYWFDTLITTMGTTFTKLQPETDRMTISVPNGCCTAPWCSIAVFYNLIVDEINTSLSTKTPIGHLLDCGKSEYDSLKRGKGLWYPVPPSLFDRYHSFPAGSMAPLMVLRRAPGHSLAGPGKVMAIVHKAHDWSALPNVVATPPVVQSSTSG